MFKILSCHPYFASDSDGGSQPAAGPVTEPAPLLPEPIVTEHTVGSLSYTATFGLMPIKNGKGETEANLSYTAYALKDQDAKSRPLTFMFNGGPGSASVWLHMGGLGPFRVVMNPDGSMPPPPFQVIENDKTWLNFTDLVFIDPVDTGYSSAVSEELTKKFLAVEGDLDLNAEFIRLFLTQQNRWLSPLFLGGESYGTFRSAGLAGKLVDHGVFFNGIILISSVLELGTLLFETGDDLPYVVYLPTLAATAWYHQRLPDRLQKLSLTDLRSEVEIWSINHYAPGLAAGGTLQGEKRQSVAAALADYTGLPQAVIEDYDLRIDGPNFSKELLRGEKLTVGRLDSRHTGFDPKRHDGNSWYDPSMAAIRGPFTAALNDYVRTKLGSPIEREYQVLRSLDWDWGKGHEGPPRTNDLLAKAFSHNPYLRVLITSGFYDLATPYFATRYTIDRLPLADAIRKQISIKEYPGGHMTYVAENELAEMYDDVSQFFSESLASPPRLLPNG